jgi:hypothetical protein
LTDIVYYKQVGDTALTLASQQGHLEVVEVLVQAGADKEKQDKVRPGYCAFGSLLSAWLILCLVHRMGARRSCGQQSVVSWQW